MVPAVIIEKGAWKDGFLEAARKTVNNPVLFARAWLNWEPHQGQARWLSSPNKMTKVLVTGRRWGKSEAAAVETLFYAVFKPSIRQGIISVTMDQGRLSFDAAVQMINRTPYLQAMVSAIRETPFPTIKFKHGGQVSVRTAVREGVYLRGHKFDRAIVDEADYLSERLINDVVRMTLVDTAGQLVLLTTPKAKRGPVYEELKRGLAGDPDVYVQTGPTTENPYVSHEYLDKLKERLTVNAWKREVEGVYTEDETAVFGWGHVQAAYEASPWRLPSDREPGKRYVQGVDLAKAEDWTVHVVLDATSKPYRMVHFERYQRAPWPAVSARIREVHKRYNCHHTLIDSTGIGEAVLDEVRDVAQGFPFTAKSKVDLITSLQLALEKGAVKFPFVRELVDELQGYAWEDANLQTDCVMALALAVWAAERGRDRRLVTW